ncbi:MAG: hypothetical protein EOL98_09375 [Negativicutes bacterium]|nr:hypothetical protein [Negativicutes bacterium]
MNELKNLTTLKEIHDYVEKMSSIEYKNNKPILTVFKAMHSRISKTVHRSLYELLSENMENYRKNVELIFHANQTDTKKKYVTYALKIKAYYDSYNYSSFLPEDFCLAIKKVHDESGISVKDIEIKTGFKHLKDVLRGKTKTKNLKLVKKLEEAYNLPSYTLLSKATNNNKYENRAVTVKDIPVSYNKVKYKILPFMQDFSFDFCKCSEQEKEEICSWILNNITVNNTNYSKKHIILQQDEYKYKELEKSPILKDEIKNLVNFKESIVPVFGYKKNENWSKSTSKKNTNMLLYFIGFYHNHYSETKLQPESYTLCLIFNKYIIHKYIDYRVKRRSSLSIEEVNFLTLVCSLLNKKYGYITQTHYFLNDELISKITQHQIIEKSITHNEKEWIILCEETRSYLNDINSEIKKQLKQKIDHNGMIKKIRDPFLPIKPILDDREPLKAYLNILIAARRRITFSTSTPFSTLNFLSPYISLMIILQTALRAKNISSLISTSGNDISVAQIYSLKNIYYIDVPSHLTKNKKRVFRELSNTNNLYEDILLYENLKKSIFPTNINYLIVTENCTPYSSESYSALVRHFTKVYISFNKYRVNPGMPGLHSHGPHALRDIIATHIIKKTGSYSDAAIAIDDSEQIVRSHYARFLPCDRAQIVKSLTSDVFNEQ